MLGATKFQQSAIEEEIRAYTNFLYDTVEGLKLKDINTAFNDLIDLITQDISRYPLTVRQLPIGEVVAQEDVALRQNIQKILPGFSKADLDVVYTNLYKLFHEYRLNKSPDCPFADENNAVVIARDESDRLYDETYQKKGKFASRMIKDGDLLSDEEIEKQVFKALLAQKKCPSAKISALKAPPAYLPSRVTKRSVEQTREQIEQDLLLAKRLDQEEKDYQYALSLQNSI
ncbi:MAG: hypothetical protein JSR17_07215 [Proteobacteria bacterium]|nr:hypothetical protein [Pseudomonadota bacterium]